MGVKTTTIQFVILFLIVVALVFTFSSAFAHWRNVNITNTVDVIVIRDDVELIVKDLSETTEDRQLVPEGRRFSIGDVDKVELAYDVAMSRELIAEVALHIEAFDVTIAEATTYAHLVEIDIQNQGQNATVGLFNDKVNILVTLRLIEPIDEAEAAAKGLDPAQVNVANAKEAYEAITGQAIVFQLRFALSQETPENDNN